MLLCYAQHDLQAQFVEKIILDDGLRDAMSTKHSCMVQAGEFPLHVIDSLIDVREYELWFDWYDLLVDPTYAGQGRQYDGHVKIVLVVAEATDTVRLNSRSMVIDSVHINGAPTTFKVSTTSTIITRAPGFAPSQTYVVDVWYAPVQRRRGLYAYSASEIDSLGSIPTNLVYTFSEPNDAAFWFPCHNMPHDKALFTLHARVPDGYTVVSNGVQTDSIVDGDSATWQSWHCPVEMPTYLFVANASKFSRLDQTATSVDGRTIPISNYYWAVDHDTSRYFSAVRAFKNLPRMVSALEQYFGPYPFDTYGHTVVWPIGVGGMEHQTMTTVSRRWLVGDLDFAFAHELGHQWSGDQVTCGTWSDIWLNEGGASWSEALWLKEVGGDSEYQRQMMGRAEKYFHTARLEPPVYDLPLVSLFNEALTYCKSAWIYHMMYSMCGDDFLRALHSWYSSAPTSKQTAEFVAFIKQEVPNTPVAWDTFFDQWLLQTYHPKLAAVFVVNTNPHDGKYVVNVDLQQVQHLEGITTVFEFPLDIRVATGTTVYDTTIIVRSNDVKTRLSVPFMPTEFDLDPDHKVLMQDTISIVTSVDTDVIQPSILGANSGIVGNPIHTRLPEGARLRVYSVTGQQLFAKQSSSEQCLIPTEGWAPGVVLLVFESETGNVSIPFILTQ